MSFLNKKEQEKMFQLLFGKHILHFVIQQVEQLFQEQKKKKEENLILGVENPDDIIKNIWNTLNNKNKVSHNTLEDSDLYKLEIEDKTIIVMNIKEVPKIGRAHV